LPQNYYQTSNRFVAALAEVVLIAHARLGSKSEHLAREVIEWGKALYTLENPANAHSLALGAELYANFNRRDEPSNPGAWGGD
jgi:predicted Rossmann fold nucleotide-binding protein DprA/Smf involved in DNA uptake